MTHLDGQIIPCLRSAAEMIGDRVLAHNGEVIGTIHEVVLDLANRRLMYVVLEVDRPSGLGESHFAVPWEALQRNRGDRSFTLDEYAPLPGCMPGERCWNGPNAVESQDRQSWYELNRIPRYWTDEELYGDLGGDPAPLRRLEKRKRDRKVSRR